MKPSLDLLPFTSQLARSLGFRGTVLLFINYYLTAKIFRAVTPAFGRLAAVEARLEGEYRAGVGRVGRESDEVACQSALPSVFHAWDDANAMNSIYKVGLLPTFAHLLHSITILLFLHFLSSPIVLSSDQYPSPSLPIPQNLNQYPSQIRIAYEWTEDFVIKYLWSAAGYGLIAVPLLITRKRSRGAGVVDGEGKGGEGKRGRKHKDGADGTVAARTESECFSAWRVTDSVLVSLWFYIPHQSKKTNKLAAYISNRYLLSLADTGGRLMHAYKDHTTIPSSQPDDDWYRLTSCIYPMEKSSRIPTTPTSPH
ncbi:hypothetical protein BDR05DRAFT_996708 [Suillus weaverae]|nr:hypothetical protein BDR05DRAFT_996708 [Suillus weaverae]